MALQNFVDNVGPRIRAAYLNGCDVLKTTIFNDSTTKAGARASLTSDGPLEILNGGTGFRSSSDTSLLTNFLNILFPWAWRFINPASAAETLVGTGIITNYRYPPNDIRRYGADDTGGGDSGAAINVAYQVAVALGNTVGGVIRIPAGIYKITTPVVFSSTTVGYLSVIGDGVCTKLINNVVGNPADPCFLIQAKSPFFLFADFQIYGNGLTGANGNGHGIAFINPDGVGVAGVSTFYPQNVLIRGVTVQGCFGTGKAFNGASIPACGVYRYGITTHTDSGCTYYNNQMSCRMLRCEKVYFSECSMDGASVGVNGLYVDSCQSVTANQSILNGAGLGGATDGCLYVAGTLQPSNGITISNSRAKDGNPAVINVAGHNNQSLNIVDSDLRQLSNGNLPIVSIGSTNHNFKVNGNYFLVVASATTAVGVQVTGSGVFTGLEIANNFFDGGGGSVYTNGVLLNSSSLIRSPVVRGNTFGNYAGNRVDFTNCININGNCNNPLIASNTFKVSTAASIITNAINLSGGAGVQWPLLLENSYDNTSAGTLTNKITNAGAVSFMKLEEGSSTIVAGRVVVTYSASMTPDASLGNEFDITVTDANAFTINTFSKAADGQRVTITIRNASGGAMGAVTWSAAFKMSAWTQPANGFSRSIDFKYNGTNWVQVSQTGVDVPN
jgi:hypothetical protein